MGIGYTGKKLLKKKESKINFGQHCIWIGGTTWDLVLTCLLSLSLHFPEYHVEHHSSTEYTSQCHENELEKMIKY